jgi:hypothetical protein
VGLERGVAAGSGTFVVVGEGREVPVDRAEAVSVRAEGGVSVEAGTSSVVGEGKGV